MSKRAVAKSTANIPGEFKDLFGRPALHKAEDEKIYNAILCEYVKDFGPLDTISRVLILDLAHYTYDIQWFRSLLPKLIREIHKQDLERRAQKLVDEADGRIRDACITRDFAVKKTNPDADNVAAEAACKDKIEQIRKELRQKLEPLVKAEEGEIDEAALFQNWIPYYAAVQNQLGPLEVKFRATVRLLDDHQQGLGQRLRTIAEKTIDIEPGTSPSAEEADSI
jgi:hypothetical protein